MAKSRSIIAVDADETYGLVVLMNMNLRPGARSDTQGVVRVFRAARADMRYLPTLHTAEEDAVFFADQLTEQGSLVAVDGDLVVGFAVFGDGSLHHLYVHPTHQGRGLGSLLVERVKAALPEGFELWTFQPNQAARRFYERHGCQCVETTDGAGNEEKVPDARYVWTP